ncbi:MAG: hypothetical protein KatS3mg003_1177 [Candidatus Nitrosocaldaceae archaeon]|nr:MAG: hypothetical protein KatS3mg003_1177 [Candidatus Nitrosocaldaceae archaeon]
MRIFKYNSKTTISTNSSYQNAVLINRINLNESLLLLHNTDNNNSILYRIYASLEDAFPDVDTESTNSSWYNLLKEQTLQPGEKALYKLNDPWRWLLIQVKSKVPNNDAIINIYHGGR